MDDQIQKSEGWRAARAGRITASRFADVIAIRRDKKPTAERMKLMRQLAFERLAGIPKHEVNSKSLSWGTDIEMYAREAYEVDRGVIVKEVGFVTHPDYPFIGGSADGLVGKDGAIEIKSPHDEQVHIQTWLEGMPDEHMAQVQGNLLVTGRQWLDFISYDPRQGERFRLYVQRIPRDDDYCADLLTKLLQFEAELQDMIKQLQAKAA